jgi:nicotinic acid mononucleotide adenylyltransferase
MAKRKVEDETNLIFTIARMNPPTPGHLLLIRKLIDTAIEKDMKHVYVILTQTQNNDKDPISCSEKQEFLNGIGKTMISEQKKRMIAEQKSLKDKIQEIQVHVECVRKENPNPVSYLIEKVAENKSITHLTLIIGEDRVPSLGRSITGIFTKSHKSVEIIPMKRSGMANLIASSAAAESSKPTMESISASYVRNLVRNISLTKDPTLFERLNTEFRSLYEPYLSDEKITELFQAIVNGFARPNANKTANKKTSNSTKKSAAKKRKTSKSKSKSPNSNSNKTKKARVKK